MKIRRMWRPPCGIGLTRDSHGRLYVDASSHPPDRTTARGLKSIPHGATGRMVEGRGQIFVASCGRPPWFSGEPQPSTCSATTPRRSTSEARRRVQKYRDTYGVVSDGDRILILGEDEGGKTDDLGPILVKADATFSTVNGQYDWTMTARLLAPQPKSDDADEEEIRSKNHSSTILNFSLSGDSVADACRFLSGGDAEVAIWERLWQRHAERADWFSYDVLQAPHHCSWHSLSYDSWSEYGEDAEVCGDARSALAQTRKGA